MKIQPLTTLTKNDCKRLITGYVSHEKYKVTLSESEIEIIFRLELMTLDKPFIMRYTHVDRDFPDLLETVAEGHSLGVYDDDELLIGLAIVSSQHWNNSLWVKEFHIAESHRGRGIGRNLMLAVIEKCREINFRIVYLETQNTNVPAIRFYRRMGFHMDAIDLSQYTNDDYPDGEICVFMKYKV